MYPQTNTDSPADNTSGLNTPSSPNILQPVALPESESVASVAWWLVLIVVIAMAARLLLFVLGPAVDMQRAGLEGSDRQIMLGHNLIAHGQLGLNTESNQLLHRQIAGLRTALSEAPTPQPDQLTPEIYSGPGYPTLIAAIEFLGLPMYTLILIQCLFSVLAVLLVFAIGHAIMDSPHTALLAATIVALHPADIVAPNALISQTLFATLILTGIWLVCSKKMRTVWHCAVAGLSCGLAVLVNPLALLIGPLLVIWMCLTDPKVRTAGSAAVLMAMCLLPPTVWIARNHHVGLGLRLSSAPYVDTYFQTINAINNAENQLHPSRQQPIGTNQLIEQLRTDRHENEDVYTTMARLSFERISSNPILYFKVIQLSMLRFFTGHSMADLYHELGLTYEPPAWPDRLFYWDWTIPGTDNIMTTILAITWFTLNIAMAALTIASIAILVWRRQWAVVLLLGGLMIYFALTAQANGMERLRLPVLGLQAILIAAMFTPAPIREPKKKKFKNLMVENFDKPVKATPLASITTGRPI